MRLVCMTFKAFANKAKDLALQHVGSWVANRLHLNQLGKVTTLRIDSAKAEIFLTVDLEGESTPVDLTMQYRILQPTLLEVVHVDASRVWMTTFINKLVPPEQKQFTVPKVVSKALSQL